MINFLKKLFGLVIEKPVFIHCFDRDIRTKKERWNDVSYIQSVEMLAENQIWISELLLALSDARKLEEASKTQQEWEKNHQAVKTIMMLLRLPEEAKIQLNAIKLQKEAIRKHDIKIN